MITMAENTTPDDSPTEIEISLDDETTLDLQSVEIDSERLPLEFSVNGVIRDVNSDIMDRLQGNDLEPVAIRFRLVGGDHKRQ